MAESKDIKVKSFRINDETAKKFKDIADGLGTNQQETLAKLIEVYEFQGDKAILTDYKADLDTFESYITSLLQMYTTSLQNNKNAKETIRDDFRKSLASKDAIIQELQDKLADAQTTKEDAVVKVKSLEEENISLKGENSKLLKRIEEKDELNKALKVADAEYKKQSDELEESIKANAELKAELESKSTEIARLQAQIEKAQNEAIMSKRQAEIDIKVAVMEVKEEYQAKVEEYQKKYTDLLEARKLEQ
jgi:chromosome segregation ATPase